MLPRCVSRAILRCFRLISSLLRSFGNVRCRDRLPVGARIGIGIAVAVGIILLFVAAGIARQRRVRRNNMAYVNNPNQGQNYYPQQSYQPDPQNGYGNQNQYQNTGYQPGYQGYPPNGNQTPGMVSLSICNLLILLF